MNYAEYCELIKHANISNELRYCQAILWLHPEVLPLRLISVGDKNPSIIIVPEKAKNRFGRVVPVIDIAKGAFAGKESITDIILPASIERLPQGAFSGCISLENITIPKKIKMIKEKTFDRCISLENIYYEGTPEEWDEIVIVHEKHEIEFGNLIPGTPVSSIIAERRINIPGNEALFSANIHFRCDLRGTDADSLFCIKMDGKDITDLFRLKG